ncbi:SDR family oxidoreductase [Sphingomonas sp. C3-2]|uniref:SDR family oxidoreductase n=1 Tax=Sphingomonas sp. C3-2 TaxID=3062169 RepID=UPI00294B94D7|nr:SDR family oxidoreductase [Sphingomonas sp. C3-2]WOK36030.1 SDR family oxidoreductase [Sphingomonas sp. C3-2]
MTAAPHRLALVTGGCHRVGAAIAARLAGAGWALALHGRTSSEPDAWLRAELDRLGAVWHGFAADLSDAAAVGTLIGRVTAHFGAAPTLLVNNASVFGADDPETMTFDALTRYFAVNTAAPVLLARDVAAAASTEQPAVIVNILDQRIRHPGRDQASYTISKLALAGATEMLARAFAPRARVCAVAPGLTLPTGEYQPDQMARLAGTMPLERLPEPADIADAVLFLAGARATTGQVIYVDGGANLTNFERDFLYMEREGA